MTARPRAIVPYLFYDDAAAALDWYARVFGFEELGRFTNAQGRVQNAEMRVGESDLWLDGGGRHLMRREGDERIWIGVWVDDVEAMQKQVESAGVEVEPPVDRSFGVRILTVPDPFGYSWGFMCRLGGASDTAQ